MCGRAGPPEQNPGEDRITPPPHPEAGLGRWAWVGGLCTCVSESGRGGECVCTGSLWGVLGFSVSLAWTRGGRDGSHLGLCPLRP